MTLSLRRDIVATLDDFRQLYRNPAMRARARAREISRRSLVRRWSDAIVHAMREMPFLVNQLIRELAATKIEITR